MVHEDYLPCSAYEGQPAHATESGFVSFFHDESQRNFFALTDEKGILLISEGYPQTAARENGIQSVIKNRPNRDFWSVKNEDGKYFLSLRAANYREIARTCEFDSEAEALAMLDYVTGEKTRKIEVAAIADTTTRANNREDDNYLACKDYAGHAGVGAEYPGLVKFSVPDGEHYFAWYDDDGKVLMRSEGYPTTGARDNGMASVNKNRDIEERFSILERLGRYFVILKAGNHQEIARSCPYDSEAAAMALFPSGRAKKGIDIPAAPLAAAAAAAASLAATTPAAPEVVKNVDKEDDYMPCEEYKGHKAGANNIAIFSHSNGQKYFVWYDSDGKVRLRSEGFQSDADLQEELALVLKYRDDKSRWETIEKGGYRMYILKDPNGREIGRSCLEKIVIVPPVAAPVAAAAPIAPPPPIVETPVIEPPKAGFPWWWLLIPLLGLLAWLAYKGCGKEEPAAAVPTAPAPEPVKPAVIDTVKTAITPAAPAAAATPDCELNWIFFDFDKSDLRAASKEELAQMAKILKQNEGYTALLSAHTDAKGSDSYNDALSQRRASTAKSYLQSLGITAARIKTTTSGESSPYAENDEPDVHRQYNRRVELTVLDKDGKEVCKSIQPPK